MLRKIVIASSLLFVSGSALAMDQYIPKPRVSISFSNGYQDYGHRDHYREVYVPYREVYVPRPVHVQPVYYNNYYRGESRGHGWGHRDVYRDERREHKQHERHHRQYHDDDD